MAIKKESRLMIENNDEKIPASGLTINLTRAASYIIAIYYVFFLLILIACYLLIPISGLFLCVTIIIMAYAQLLFSKSLLRTHPQAIKKINFTELGWCYLKLNNGRIIKADIEADTIVSEHIVIVNLHKQSDQSVLMTFFNNDSVILTSKELGKEPFRQLKCYLHLINFSKKEEY